LILVAFAVAPDIRLPPGSPVAPLGLLRLWVLPLGCPLLEARPDALEVRLDLRDINAACLSAEDQGDRLLRTGSGAGTVTNTVSRFDKGRLAVDETENMMTALLRAGTNAAATSETTVRIDHRMQ